MLKPLENVDGNAEDEELTTAFDEKENEENHHLEETAVHLDRLIQTDDQTEDPTEDDTTPLTNMKEINLEQLSPEQEEKKSVQNDHQSEEEEPVNLYMISKLFLLPGLREIFDLTTIAVL